MSAKSAIVTGGTGALGSVVVDEFLKKGMAVGVPVVPGHRAGESAARQPGGGLFFHPADLRREEDVGGFIRAALIDLGSIDVLVNIAGGYAGGNRVEETPVSEWDDMMELNLQTTFLMCRAVLPIMRRQGYGRIVNIAAMPALRPAAKRGAYAVSKGGVVTLTQVIHEEVKGSGITINAIAPGTLLTEANRASMPDADTAGWVPLSEVAALISYLCTDDARSVSGNIIRIFGGA
jgi:NAD(P)-dependent dehydrogenase (short-subunit alcohol dehydrogenase family)